MFRQSTNNLHDSPNGDRNRWKDDMGHYSALSYLNMTYIILDPQSTVILFWTFNNQSPGANRTSLHHTSPSRLYQACSKCALFELSFIVAASTVPEDPDTVEGMAENSATASSGNAQTKQGLTAQPETVDLKSLVVAGNAVDVGTNQIPLGNVFSALAHIQCAFVAWPLRPLHVLRKTPHPAYSKIFD